MVYIAPSILSADFAILGEEIKDIEQGGADLVHIDVMDGRFVPNLTMGPLVVEAIRPWTTLPLDVHLMMEQPESLIPQFIAAGADYISVHVEACRHLHSVLQMIKDQGVRAGVALNPATPVMMIEPVLPDVDFVLVMTVNPGFGGQSFITETLEKIKQLKQMLTIRGLDHVHIEVDGGVNEDTVPLVTRAGANMLVAGSAVFNQSDRGAAITQLRKLADLRKLP